MTSIADINNMFTAEHFFFIVVKSEIACRALESVRIVCQPAAMTAVQTTPGGIDRGLRRPLLLLLIIKTRAVESTTVHER
jgi:hypothetical protein